jgi:hypothetical protein
LNNDKIRELIGAPMKVALYVSMEHSYATVMEYR